MSIERLLFSIFAASSLVSAMFVVLSRDPVKSALSLVGCFFSVACLFLLQAAELMAVLEVLVYAGAIMVLFVFVIMLVEHRDEPLVASGLIQRVIVPVKVMSVALVVINIVVALHRTSFAGGATLPAGFGSPAVVGKMLYTRFLFHFELTSVLLLVAIVGAVVISRNVTKSAPREVER